MNGKDHYDRLYKKSVEYLNSVSALELMNDVKALSDDIHRDVVRYHLPGSVVAGILMCEIQTILNESESLATENAIMKLGDVIERYLDDNFMKKERNQERR